MNALLEPTSPLPADRLSRYNVSVPRYTSYPTVPLWDDRIPETDWLEAFRRQFQATNQNEGISLYLHLPFCEALCTYCGCNKKITTNHSVEPEYLRALLKEWGLYLRQMDERPLLREIHLGGGTPTFFSADNLRRLLETLFESADLHPSPEFSFEGHPNNTTGDHLWTLHDLGFRRVSFGVQDNDPLVQRAINRIQPFGNVIRATELARTIGYTSVNYDLVYGLPFQTLAGMEKTLEAVIGQQPDRIAFYSYAHVPWKSRAQRLFDENDLPSAEEKMALYALGQEAFRAAGYQEIGMDHYARPTDGLSKALTDGGLHRNFMGYTTARTSLLLGLGVSSISDAGTAYAQNEKELAHYYQALEEDRLPIRRGCLLTEEDQAARRYILDISCRRRTRLRAADLPLLKTHTLPELLELEADGLIRLNGGDVEVTEGGRPLIRNICRAFDFRLWAAEGSVQGFSRAI